MIEDSRNCLKPKYSIRLQNRTYNSTFKLTVHSVFKKWAYVVQKASNPFQIEFDAAPFREGAIPSLDTRQNFRRLSGARPAVIFTLFRAEFYEDFFLPVTFSTSNEALGNFFMAICATK
jgi:hypothetical protein